MRFSPARSIPLAVALLACASAPAIGAVGDITTFPTRSPANAVPQMPVLGPDGAVWFVGRYVTDPGVTSLALRKRGARREMGTPPCCSRLIRVGMDGSLSVRGRDVFGSRPISATATYAGNIWAAAEESSGGPFRIWRYSMDGSATGFDAASIPGKMTAGPDGNLWYQVTGGIARMSSSGASLPQLAVDGSAVLVSGLSVAWTALGDPALRRINRDGSTNDFPVPSAAQSAAASPDGSVWWANSSDQKVGRLVPGESPRETSGDGTLTPTGIVVTPNGFAWTNNDSSGRVTRFDTSLAPQGFTIPGAVATVSPVVGSDGNVWLSYLTAGGDWYFARILTGVTPTSTRNPAASGKVKAGLVLTADPGQWDYLPTGYAYAWQRCAAADPSSCTSILGATASTHTVTADDVGGGVRVVVTASNLNGASGGVASNIVTGDSSPSSAFTFGKVTRKGYVITTRVRIPGPGAISQVGAIPGKAKARKPVRGAAAKPKPVRVCAPKSATARAAGTHVIRCVLSKRARTMLASRPLVVTLATTFTPTGGTRSSQNRSVRVPIIAAKRR